jgi:hypothetical protein
MAVSPPFSIAETLPAETDLISIFPGQEHPFRDTVESWLTFLSDPTTGLLKSTAFDFPFEITNSAAGTFILLESTEGGAAASPIIELYRNSASPAAADVLGTVIFYGEDSAGNKQEYGRIAAAIADTTSTSEDGTLTFSAMVAGSAADRLTLNAAGVTIGGTLSYAGAIAGLTGTGALDSGSITSGFGAINIGADPLTAGAIAGTTGTFSGAVSAAAISGTTGTFSGAISGVTGTFSGAIQGTTGTFSGAVSGDSFASSLGAVGAPSYTFTGDLNTGMWSPAADIIAWSADGTEMSRLSTFGWKIGKTTSDYTVAGFEAFPSGFLALTTASSSNVLQINRQDNDGALVSFLQANVAEGSISVSGTTVTYGSFSGSHESQLAYPAQRGQMLRGTILESVDALCNWYDRGELLAKVKVSDMAGSRSVYGVFFDWYDGDAEDDTLNVASLGAFCIRIAPGEQVHNGDLIESNGDGCGRVQADDLMRSSTVAKITVAIPIDTYPDRSSVYPCTLHCG